MSKTETVAEKAAHAIREYLLCNQGRRPAQLEEKVTRMIEAAIDERTKPLVKALRLARRTFARLNYKDSVGGILYIIDAALATFKKGGAAHE